MTRLLKYLDLSSLSIGDSVERVTVNGESLFQVTFAPSTNVDLPRHPTKGHFQGLPKNAAAKGGAHSDYPAGDAPAALEGTQVDKTKVRIVPVPTDDLVEAEEPDDSTAEAQAESDEDMRTEGAGGKRVNKGLESNSVSNCGGDMPMMNDFGGPHMASKDAASMSVRADHPAARDHAIAAADASKADDPKEAAAAHLKAAVEHEKEATAQRKMRTGGDPEPHDRAAAMHRKAASMHQAVTNQQTNESTQRDLPMNRNLLIAALTANCSCDNDRKAISGLSDQSLSRLAANAFPPPKKNKGEEDKAGDDEDDEPEANANGSSSFDKGKTATGEKQAGGAGTVSEYSKNKRMSLKEMLANASPEEQAVWNVACEVHQREQLSVVRRLIANVADPERRKARGDALMKRPLAELREMLELLPQPTQNQQAPNPQTLSFFGFGPGDERGQQITDNAADDVLDDVTINWAEERAAEMKESRQTA